MRINHYSVALQAEHYNLELGAVEANIETTKTADSNTDESAVSKLSSIENSSTSNESEISVALSKAILKNIQNKSPQSLQDTKDMQYTYTQSQGLNFQAKAYLQTDSKEIELSLDISLSSSFVQKSSISFERIQELKDPLILSFDSTMPHLSSTTFAFDIDSDGEKDQISQLGSNSAFIALDSNKNGVIDNGNELFGTQSGNGFKDLQAYDEDKNGWIDENDPIFENLRVWKKSEGKDELIALGEVGIGAIFLGNVQSPFSLKSNTNKTLGEIQKSSFFVYEDGKAGAISQVDLLATPVTKNEVENVKDLQKNLSSLKIKNLYKQEQDSDATKGSSPIEKLQKRLQILEKKLLAAQEDKKIAIQAQIEVINAQIIALLSQELS